MFGNENDKNKAIREQLERGGGQRAWAVILDLKFRHATGRYAIVPMNQTGHYKLTLRVDPQDDVPFEATVRASFASHTPRKGGSIGVIFDSRDHAKLAICPEWTFSPETAGKARTQEMIAAFLGRQTPSSQN